LFLSFLVCEPPNIEIKKGKDAPLDKRALSVIALR